MENDRSYIGDAVEAAMKIRTILFVKWMVNKGYSVKDDLEKRYDEFDEFYKKQNQPDRKTINDF